MIFITLNYILCTPCKQYGIPQYIICTDCTSYLWMLAWRWSNKNETCCHNKKPLFINSCVLSVTLKRFVLLVSLSTLSSASFLKTRHDAILQMYELLLHSIFLLFLSDLSQNRKCTNTSHTEPKMTDFCKQYRIPQYIICTNCTSYLWMLAWRWYNKTETCCHNKTLLFINCYVLGVTLKYFVLLVSLSTLSSASFLKTRHDAILLNVRITSSFNFPFIFVRFEPKSKMYEHISHRT